MFYIHLSLSLLRTPNALLCALPSGAGAGRFPTANAVVGDILRLNRLVESANRAHMTAAPLHSRESTPSDADIDLFSIQAAVYSSYTPFPAVSNCSKINIATDFLARFCIRFDCNRTLTEADFSSGLCFSDLRAKGDLISLPREGPVNDFVFVTKQEIKYTEVIKYVYSFSFIRFNLLCGV